MSPEVVMNPIRHILLPTALSPEYEGGLEHACFLAEHFGAVLTVYHALEIPPGEYGNWAYGQEDAVWARAEKDARHRLTRRTESRDVDCRIVLERGVPAPRVLGDLAILRAADRVDADLIVMATRPARGGCGLFIGGLMENVVDCSRRPVLCVPTDAKRPPLPFAASLFPRTSRSYRARRCPWPQCWRRLSMRASLACTSWAAAARSAPPWASAHATTLEGLVAAFLRSGLPGLEVAGRVHETSAATWEGIVDAARTEEASMIVMSTAGHDSACDRWLGSNAEHVLRRTSCPVLIVGPANAAMLLRKAA